MSVTSDKPILPGSCTCLNMTSCSGPLGPVLSVPRADASLGRATNAGARIRMAALQFLENSDRPQPRC
jgi:hypothetical protein